MSISISYSGQETYYYILSSSLYSSPLFFEYVMELTKKELSLLCSYLISLWKNELADWLKVSYEKMIDTSNTDSRSDTD